MWGGEIFLLVSNACDCLDEFVQVIQQNELILTFTITVDNIELQ